MGAWTYKSYAIIQKNRRKGNRWISTACFRTEQGELNLTAHGKKQEGYAQERLAQYATEKFVRESIDRLVSMDTKETGKRRSWAS
jgi:hypothetical protein